MVPKPRNHFFSSRVFKLGIYVLLLFCTAEAGLQLRAHFRFGEAIASYYEPHPSLGKVLKPNYRRTGSLGTLSINGLGFRGEEFQPIPPEGTVRVFCLGDSVVFGGGGMMSDSQTFPALTQELLNQHSSLKYEVINAGVPGWTSQRMGEFVALKITQYSPQIVLIYPSANDIAAVMKNSGTDHRSKPYINLNILNGWLSRNSVLFNAFRESTKFLRPNAEANKFKSFPDSALTRFTADYEKIVIICEQHGIQPILMTQALAFNKILSEKEQQRIHGGDLWGLSLEGAYKAHEKLNQAIRIVASAHQVKLIELDKLIPSGEEFYFDAVHFNPKGQALVASIIARALIEPL